MTLDRRINAFRDDLAEKSLQGKVEAGSFVEGRPARVTAPVLDLRPRPDPACGMDTQLLFGETVRIFDEAGDWAWIKADLDDYVGYAQLSGLAAAGEPATHMIAAPRSFAYGKPDMKTPASHALSMGSRLSVIAAEQTRGTDFLILDSGDAVFAGHCRPIAALGADDHATIAARLLETPYLWGGRSGFGIDCSGLVQLSLLMAGKGARRDSDMQAAGLGEVIAPDQRKRGDLVFWRGHVAIFEDRDTVIHANGNTMTVSRETLAQAIARIRPSYGEPTGYRRP